MLALTLYLIILAMLDITHTLGDLVTVHVSSDHLCYACTFKL
jgi:hypothetical protein